MMIKNISLLTLLCAAPFLGTSPALANPTGSLGNIPTPQVLWPVKASSAELGAQKFIDSVASRGIGFLSSGQANISEQKKSFRALLRDSFDLSTIGRFALGKYWRAASATERAQYQRLFETMVVDVYAARFASYNGQQLKTTGTKTVEGGDVIVNSEIIPVDGSEKIKVDWRVRNAASTPKIVDVVIEGVSMSVTQRSDFAAVIGGAGGEVSALIAHLKNGRKG
jgi:phospholipid transport system substrate-binding protein